MNINIRRAVKEDCARMMELVQELAVYEREPEAVTVSFEHFVESGFGEKPVWWAFVAELPQFGLSRSALSRSALPRSALTRSALTRSSDRGEVVGFALWYIRYSTWKGQRMYLEDLLVTEKMRGHGIGKLLFDRLLEECREKKYSGMAWQVLGWNEPAINFYKKYPGVQFDAGWTNCMINF